MPNFPFGRGIAAHIAMLLEPLRESLPVRASYAGCVIRFGGYLFPYSVKT